MVIPERPQRHLVEPAQPGHAGREQVDRRRARSGPHLGRPPCVLGAREPHADRDDLAEGGTDRVHDPRRLELPLLPLRNGDELGRVAADVQRTPARRRGIVLKLDREHPHHSAPFPSTSLLRRRPSRRTVAIRSRFGVVPVRLSISAASDSIVGWSKTSRKATSACRSRWIRDSTWWRVRVAPELEEVVVNADRGRPEHLAPDGGDVALRRRRRFRAFTLLVDDPRAGSGSARRSILPLLLRGSDARTVIDDGRM